MYMQDNQRGNIWVWVGVAVVLIVIVVAVFWKPSAKAPSSGTSTSTASGPAYAPPGGLIQGFPASLVLDAGPSPTYGNSYAVQYSSGTVNQYTANWNSSSSVGTIFSDYQAYLTAHGWKLSNLMTTKTGRGLHAENASSTIGLAIIDEGKFRTVTLSYVTH